MLRDVRTPLTLWICAAVFLHHMFAAGGEYVGEVADDHSALYGLAAKARSRAFLEERTIEVSLEETPMPPDPLPPDPNDPANVKPQPPAPEDEKKDDKKDVPKPEDKKKPEPKPPEPPKVTPPKPKAPEPPKKDDDKKIAVVPKKAEPPPAPPPPDLQPDKRIAVKQIVKPDQKDNPDAKFIGDQANHVDKETRSTQTSHDQDSANPTPAGNHAGPTPDPGDADRTKIAESDEHKGNKDHAPGEKGTDFDVMHTPPLPSPAAVQGPATNKPAPANTDKPAPPSPPQAEANPTPQPTAPPGALTPPTPAGVPAPPAGASPSPNVADAPGSGWTWKPNDPNATTGPAGSAGPTASMTPKQEASPVFGRGARVAPGKLNPNLSQGDVKAIVGVGEIKRMREADGERRKSEHRGSWVASNFDRWKSAIENYVSSVKPGNQTALNTAAVPFATYLNSMHNRIHPFFADSFLGSLDSLPADHPLNNMKMFTSLEIVLTKEGHIHKVGVVHTSGVTAFDIAALDSVDRAKPFGPAPTAIISKDGFVYLHWEFHREEQYACSTMNARPYLLTTPATVDPVAPPPAAPTAPTNEKMPPANTPDTRQGRRDPEDHVSASHG